MDRLEAAKAIAVAAGKLGLGFKAPGRALKVEPKGHQDLVSEADKALETYIRQELAKAFPNDGILGEEFGHVAGTSGFTWIIDPIDGTANFVRGIPAWTVVLACVRDVEPVVGVIHDPNAGETFAAALGDGAFLNDQPIQVVADARLTDGSVGVGYSNRVDPLTASRAVDALVRRGGVFYRNASGALMLAYVAAGRLLGYCEAHMNPWDCVAGMLLITEAGGRIMPHDKARMIASGDVVVASAPGIYDDLVAMCVAAFAAD